MKPSILRQMAAEIAEVVSHHTGGASEKMRVNVSDTVSFDKHLVSIAMYDKDDTPLFSVNVDLQENQKH